MSEPRLQLPIVIVTAHADPAELAEKIVRQNPEYFGHVDVDGVYGKGEPAETIPVEVWRSDMKGVLEGRDAAIDAAADARKWQLIFLILAAAGWGLSLARGIWGF